VIVYRNIDDSSKNNDFVLSTSDPCLHVTVLGQ
jgi:hypothetical protein